MGIIYTWNGNPAGGGGGGGSSAIATPYPTFGDFPLTAPDGSLAIAEDTGTLYVFNNGMWLAQAASSSMYTVNLFTLDSTDITNGFVTLTATPTAPTLAVLTVIGGPMQDYGNDYIVITDQLTWSGFNLDGILTAGDKLVVQFI